MENPLYNEGSEHVILQLLFESFPVDILRACRGVSKKWYAYSLPEWRKRTVLRLCNSECPHDQANFPLSLSAWNQLTAFRGNEDELLQLQFIPYVNFKLVFSGKWGAEEYLLMDRWGWAMISLSLTGGSMTNSNLTDIFFKFTPRLEKLQLSIVMEESVVPYVQMGVRPVKQKLISLKIHQIPSIVGSTMSWTNIISAAPNLKDLQLLGLMSDELADILRVLMQARSQNTTKFQLAHLDCQNTRITEEVSRLLADMTLPLKSLGLNFDQLNLNDAIIPRVLESCHSTLEEIRGYAIFRRFPNPYIFQTVQFGRLRRIELDGYIVEDFTFLRFTPNLQSLILRCSSRDVAADVLVTNSVRKDREMLNLKFPNVEDFRLEFEGRELCSRSVLQVTAWMPNLRVLSMTLNFETFKLVCTNLHNLEELKDWGITGIDFPPESRLGSCRLQ